MPENTDRELKQQNEVLRTGYFIPPVPAYIEVTMRVPQGCKPQFENKTVQAMFDKSRFPDVRFYCREDFYPELESLILKVLNGNP